MKKVVLVMLICALAWSFSGLASKATAASSDDIKWVAKCMSDNSDQGQSAEVVRKYCECMVSKMEEDETQSVTQWEKFHPQERKKCDEVAGWK